MHPAVIALSAGAIAVGLFLLLIVAIGGSPAFAAKRLAQAVPTLFGVSIVVFVLLASSGDPTRMLVAPDASAEELRAKRAELHLDQPLVVRYGYWAKSTLTGDFGRSYFSKRPVGADLLRRLPATLELAVTVMFVATLTAMGVALLSARNPGGPFDSTARTVIFVFLAMPSFWLGIELIILFSRRLGWFPPAGRGAGSIATWEGLRSHVAHLALPALTLGVGTGALLSRVLRASLLETLQSDYVRTARAKGLGGRAVLVKHALRNALIPFLTLGGLTIAGLLEGSIIVESIFAWPGVGQWMVEGIKGRDTPVVMAGVLLSAVAYTGVNLLVDVLYGVVDPRIRLGGSR